MKFKSLLSTLLLLILVGYAYATKPRELGIGLRYGYTIDSTNFTGTGKNDGDRYIQFDIDEKINNPGTTKIPIFIQFDENLLSKSTFTYWFLDLTRLIQTDHPPYLQGTTYTDLIRTENYEVPSANTNTSKFASNYPQYSSVIGNASNPSLSADYFISKIAFGKTWGVFYPSSDRHRWGSIGIGAGIHYLEGSYQVNVCDPYLLSSEISEAESIYGKFRKGFCLQKSALYSAKVNHFSWELNLPLILYSYIGNLVEFNFFEYNLIYSQPSHHLKNENVLEPNFQYQSLNLISVIGHL